MSPHYQPRAEDTPQLFERAQATQSILLFDEADSLFAKRTDVKSSNDRYANHEINLLLQEVERYTGIVILTTNLFGGLDDAVKRRIQYRVTSGRANDLAQGRAFEAAPGQATRAVENVDAIFPTHTADTDAIAADVNTGVTTPFSAEQIRVAHRDLLRQWVESRLARVRLPDHANSAEGIGYDPDAVRTAMQADLQTSPYAQPAGRVVRVREIATRLRREDERRTRTTRPTR